MSSIPPVFNPSAARQGLASVQASLGQSRGTESALVNEAQASRSLPVSKEGNTPLASA
jgi:hypothetical protein